MLAQRAFIKFYEDHQRVYQYSPPCTKKLFNIVKFIDQGFRQPNWATQRFALQKKAIQDISNIIDGKDKDCQLFKVSGKDVVRKTQFFVHLLNWAVIQNQIHLRIRNQKDPESLKTYEKTINFVLAYYKQQLKMNDPSIVDTKAAPITPVVETKIEPVVTTKVAPSLRSKLDKLAPLELPKFDKTPPLTASAPVVTTPVVRSKDPKTNIEQFAQKYAKL